MTKHRERALALQALYSLSFTPAGNERELARAFLRSGGTGRPAHAEQKDNPPRGFAWELTRGVWQSHDELDQIIEKFSHNWSVARIGRMERILLQLALHEMLYMGGHPKIVISESMELADEFGASSAKSFVNGILDAAGKERMGE